MHATFSSEDGHAFGVMLGAGLTEVRGAAVCRQIDSFLIRPKSSRPPRYLPAHRFMSGCLCLVLSGLAVSVHLLLQPSSCVNIASSVGLVTKCRGLVF